MTTHITKTWFDGEKVVTQEIPEADIYLPSPVAYSYTSKVTGAQGFSHHPLPRFTDAEHWDIVPLYAAPPQRKLEQAQPVATIGNWGKVIWAEDVYPQLGDKLYATPPQRKPLTDFEIKTVIASIDPAEQYLPNALKQFARAIEAAHGIRENT